MKIYTENQTKTLQVGTKKKVMGCATADAPSHWNVSQA
jgi:hypothetical protein